MDLLAELKDLLSGLAEEKVDHALCGGLAMAVYAFPRATLDIDLLIQPGDLPRVRDVAGRLGFSLDAEPMDFKGGAVRIRRLCKISPGSREVLLLDLILVTPEIRDVWESRRQVTWEGGTLPVVSPEGLIRLKSLRGSGQDLDDILHLRSLTHEG